MRLRLAVLFATTAVLAGCGIVGGGTSTAPSTSSTPDAAVGYMDKVCSAAAAFASAPKTPPQLNTTDPAKLKADMGVYMGQMADAFNRTATQLRAVGKSPIAGGDEQVTGMVATFAELGKTFADAKVKIEQADAADPNGGLQAAGEAIAKLTEVATPLKDLQAHPELLTAAQKAPKCQDLTDLEPTSAAPTK
jgi:hypothetical protein